MADIIDGDVLKRRASRRESAAVSRSRRALPALLALLACATALAGCGEKREPTGAQVPLYPVSVRDANNNLVTVAKAPGKIAVAGQSPVQIAAALAIPVTNVGDSSGNLDFGLVRELAPGLILSGSEVDRAALKRARARGIAVYVVPDRTLDGIERALSDISLLAGVPLRGRTARDRVARAREDVRAALAGTKPVTVFFDTGLFATVSDSSFIGSILREAGGTNIAGPDPEEGPFPIERLRQLRPEVLVLASGLRITLSDLRRDRRIKWIPAIRNGRIVHVNMKLLEPGPEAVTALSGLARAFHPDAFH